MTRPDDARRVQYFESNEKPVYRPRWWMLAAGIGSWLVIIWLIVRIL